MGTVCWRGEGTGPAGGVALWCPANCVAWRSLEGNEMMNVITTALWTVTVTGAKTGL